jgi:hypothetical protein
MSIIQLPSKFRALAARIEGDRDGFVSPRISKNHCAFMPPLEDLLDRCVGHEPEVSLIGFDHHALLDAVIVDVANGSKATF